MTNRTKANLYQIGALVFGFSALWHAWQREYAHAAFESVWMFYFTYYADRLRAGA